METPDIRYLSNNPVHIISAMLFSFQLKPVFSYLTMWMTLTTAEFNDIIFSVNRGSSRIEGTTLQWNCQTERGWVKGRGITLLQDWVSFVWTGDTWAGPDPPCLKWESPGAEWWGINPLRLGRGGGIEGGHRLCWSDWKQTSRMTGTKKEVGSQPCIKTLHFLLLKKS